MNENCISSALSVQVRTPCVMKNLFTRNISDHRKQRSHQYEIPVLEMHGGHLISIDQSILNYFCFLKGWHISAVTVKQFCANHLREIAVDVSEL